MNIHLIRVEMPQTPQSKASNRHEVMNIWTFITSCLFSVL